MGMKAKVGLLALLVATVAGAIAFDKFRAKTASATDQVEPQKSDQPAVPEVAATPTGKGSGMTPVKEIVAAPKPKPEPPKPPRPVAPTPPAPKPEPPKPALPLPTDFTKADPPKPMDTWKPPASDPVDTAKGPSSKPVEPAPPVEIVNRTEQPNPSTPSGLDPSDVIRPPAEGTPKPSAPAPIAPDSYQIAAGDSLYVISQKVYGTPRHWREIFDANRDTLEAEDRLVVGKTIRIPKIAAAPASKAPEVAPLSAPELAGKKTHVVKAGDSLSTISKLYFKESRFWQKIAEANTKVLKDPHDLKVGMVLVIPEVEAAPAVKPPEAAPAPGAPSPETSGKRVHVIVEGDTLSGISKKYYGTAKHWKLIDQANKLSEMWAKYDDDYDNLQIGQKLIIPDLPADVAPTGGAPSAPKAPSIDLKLAELGTPYTIQEGDTLSSIAERHLGSPNDWVKIYELNKGVTMKDEHSLSVGKVIVIPFKSEKPAPSPPKAPAVEAPAPKPPALEKIDTLPPAAKKDPEPPKRDNAGTSGGTKLIGD